MEIKTGDVVLVKKKVNSILWINAMNESVGKTFRVEKIDFDGDPILLNGYAYPIDALEFIGG